MGIYIGNKQKSARLESPGDAAIEQDQADDRVASARSVPVALNRPVPTVLYQLPRRRKTSPSDVTHWDDLPSDITPFIVSKLDLDAAKALRLTNKSFRGAGAARFTGLAVHASAEIVNMAEFFRDSTNICAVRITDKGNFGDQDLARLIEMLPEYSTKISQLDLSGCHRITDAGVDQLKRMTAMQSLNLAGCDQITDAGLRNLSSMAAMQTLDLRYCHQITDAGLGHLTNMTAMQSLNLRYCDRITDTGFGYLSGMTAMQSLDLRYSDRITDTGLGHLSGMTAMQSLDLRFCNQITDAGLGHLSDMTAMQSLDLSLCNQIADAGLRHLSEMTAMRWLNLAGCMGISETQVAQLKARGIEVRR